MYEDYEDYEDYYEPSQFDLIADEFTEKVKDIVKGKVKNYYKEIEYENKHLKEENQELKAENERLKKEVIFHMKAAVEAERKEKNRK